MRIWNYNKSRQHSNRGIRDVVIYLDGQSIFEGSIQKAPGTIFDIKQCCEVILFTSNTETIKKIAEKDWVTDILER